MRDYIEALLSGQEEPERQSETAELDISPAVVRRETVEERPAADGGEPPPAGPGTEPAAPPAAGALPPAEEETDAAKRRSGAASGAEALWPALTDTRAVVRRTARGEDGAPPANAEAAAGGAPLLSGLLHGREGARETAALPVRRGGAGGGASAPASGAAWLAEQVGRSLSQAAGSSARPAGSVTVIRPVERGGGTWEAESLDRMFRRDARRYDGGFQLL